MTIRITETLTPPPDALADWSPLYQFEPDDLRFEAPVELKLPWASDSSTAGELAIYLSSEPGGCELAPLTDNDQKAGFNQGRSSRWAGIVGLPNDPACRWLSRRSADSSPRAI